MPMSVRTANPSEGRRWRPLSVVLALVAATPLIDGCDTGLQAKLFAARDTRYKSAKTAVYAVEVARNKALADTLPDANAPFEGETHPMVAWRKAGALRADAAALEDLGKSAKPLKGAAIGAMGTPAQSAAEVGTAYLKDVAEYWSGTATLSRYLTSISHFDEAVARARSAAEEKAKTAEGWEFVDPPCGDEARFDQ